jgi:hypothetical protein
VALRARQAVRLCPDACGTETTGAARGRERTCEAISLRRHCPDQVDGGRRLVFQLAGLSAFRLPRPSRRPPSIVHPLGRGHQGPRSHFFYDPVAVGRLGRVGHLTARHTRCVIAPRVPPPDGQSRSCWVHTRAGSRVGLFTAACAISLPWSVPACERSLMATERCDRTDFPIEMCHCPDHGGPKSATPYQERVLPAPEYDGPRPPRDAILVSATGIAHWYGCDHLPDYVYLVPPKYGWIDDHNAWSRIGNHEVAATGGNLARRAQRRCLDCDF